jgi:hypothetical protein
MSYRTLSELTQDVIKTIGLVSGTAVQTYTEPNVKVAVQQTFDMMFRKNDWQHLTEWMTLALDGTLGIPSTNIDATVKEWTHVRKIFVANTDQRVVQPLAREHLSVAGSQPLFWTPLPWDNVNAETRVLQFWPKTATGSVDIFVKKKPANFGNDDKVPFPSDLMQYGAAWNVLANDGINPDAAERARVLFEVCYSDYINEQQFEKGHGTAYRRRNQFVMGNTI